MGLLSCKVSRKSLVPADLLWIERQIDSWPGGHGGFQSGEQGRGGLEGLYFWWVIYVYFWWVILFYFCFQLWYIISNFVFFCGVTCKIFYHFFSDMGGV